MKRKHTYILFSLVALSAIFVACKKNSGDLLTMKYDPETVPMISSDSVTMFISDSGIVRYKVLTKIWDMYDQIKDPYWFFPEGVYLEQFDTTQTAVATVVADSAWYFTKRREWELRGHVFIQNINDETFASEELFWDENRQRIYSNKDVVINRPGKGLINASRFDANQQMTEYKFFRTKDSQIYVYDSPKSEHEGDSTDKENEE